MYFVFCISNTFVKSISQSILKYFSQLYFVFKYYLNVFYPALLTTLRRHVEFYSIVECPHVAAVWTSSTYWSIISHTVLHANGCD